MLASRARQHTCVRHADNVYYELHLLTFVGAREQRKSCEELNHNAPKTPHVNLLGVREHSEHYVWCSVEPALNVRVNDFILQTAAAEVCDCNPTFVLLLHQNVFRFKVTMNHPQVFQVSQRRE